MDQDPGVTWYLAYFPNSIAMGIISILIPLYLVEELKGSLIDLGIMTFVATVLLIPSSLYLGRFPDRYRRAKPFILSSFLGVSLVLFLMSVITNVTILQLLYVLMNLVAYLKGPSTSVLIAESFERSRWSSVLAKLGFVEGIGGAAGLAFCSFTIDQIGYDSLLKLTAYLVLASVFLCLLAIHDVPIYVERFLDRLDRLTENIETFSYHLTDSGSLAPSSQWRFGREPNMALFGLGTAFFALAASNAFTPLPVYLLEKAQLPTSMIFTSFFIRSIFGATSFLMTSKWVGSEGGGIVKMATVMRMILITLLPVTVLLPTPYPAAAITAILSIIAFSWSLYSVGADVVILRHASSGSLGVYDALTGIGGAVGGLTGGLVPTFFGFEVLFIISSGLFAFALALFILGLK
jgi:predicted MFS family arabinose efflux permease